MRTAAKDLHDASKDPWHFATASDVDFELRDFSGAAVPFSRVLRAETARLSEEAIADEAATRELFEQLSSVMSTRENVNAQVKMERLTWGTILLSCVSIAIAWPNWSADIISLWELCCRFVGTVWNKI